jgi:hypothetical protein
VRFTTERQSCGKSLQLDSLMKCNLENRHNSACKFTYSLRIGQAQRLQSEQSINHGDKIQ